jgi:hypothetical protein
MPRPTVSFAVFAYNEEGRIAAALDAIAACADEADLVVHVLINGCTDGTERVVRAHPAPGLALRPVVIARGDKANAWNHYVHEVAPEDAAIHVFTDGDMLLGRGSVAGFLRCFAAEPDAWGCAGLPSGGRSRDAFRDKLVREREMAGNLYALRGSCVMAFRRRGIRLPFGIFGEDSLSGASTRADRATTGASSPARTRPSAMSRSRHTASVTCGSIASARCATPCASSRPTCSTPCCSSRASRRCRRT